MATGAPREKMFLRWSDIAQSFFDDNVQTVLDERHPDNWKFYQNKAAKFYPVKAWGDCEAALASGTVLFAELLPLERDWFLRLLSAVSTSHLDRERRLRNPQRIIDKLERWRLEHALAETAKVKYTREDARRVNAIVDAARKIKETVENEKLLGCPPLYVNETPPPPAAYFEGMTAPTTPGASRTAVHNENARRDQIMRHWAACWLAFVD